MDSVNTNIPQIKSVQVVPIRPEGMDEKRLLFAYEGRDETAPKAMYIVKIYLQEGTPITGQGAALYLGDQWIRKYSEFSGGIFFNVYDPDFFQKHAGAMIRFSVDHETFYDTNMRLPSAPRSIAAARVAAEASLPSKADALRS